MTTALENGIAAAKAGNKTQALQYLKQAVTENPRDTVAWLWVASLVEQPEKKKVCFQKVLEIDPSNQYALKGMESLQSAPIQEAPQPRQVVQPSPARQALQPQPSNPPRQSVPSPQVRPEARPSTAARVSAPKVDEKNKAGKLPFNLNFKTIVIGVVILFSLLCVVGGLSSEKSQGDVVMMLIVGFWGAWILSGYYGSYLLMKKGHGLNLAGCAILAGGAPLLLPAVLGPIMFFWGRSAKDKNSGPDGYLICPKCQNRTPINSTFCASCGAPIPHGNNGRKK